MSSDKRSKYEQNHCEFRNDGSSWTSWENVFGKQNNFEQKDRVF